MRKQYFPVATITYIESPGGLLEKVLIEFSLQITLRDRIFSSRDLPGHERGTRKKLQSFCI